MAAHYVAVIGAGSDVAPALLAEAEEVGAALARRGAIVVCGGLGGVMAAACAAPMRRAG